MAEGDLAIGLEGGMPWRLPADLARFRYLTMGHPVIMGRKTWEPLAERGLPGRHMIILSSSEIEDVTVARSLEEALESAAELDPEGEVFIAGGASLYAAALEANLIDRMYLTIVHGDVAADTFFPQFDPTEWSENSIERIPADEENPYSTTFKILNRRRA